MNCSAAFERLAICICDGAELKFDSFHALWDSKLSAYRKIERDAPTDALRIRVTRHEQVLSRLMPPEAYTLLTNKGMSMLGNGT